MFQNVLKSKRRMELVELHQVKFDESYQREEKSKIDYYVEHWNPEKAGYPIICQRSDGSLWGVDGRQRIAAMRQLKIKHWNCVIIPSSGRQYEADLYLGYNVFRTAHTKAEEMKAAITANEKTAMIAHEAAIAAGMEISKQSGGNYSKPGKVITCHGTFWRLAKKFESSEIMVRALKLIARTWPMDQKALAGPVIDAVTHLVHDQGDVLDDEHFVTMVGEKAAMVYAQRVQIITSGGKRQLWYMLIVEQYNKNLRGRKRLDPKISTKLQKKLEARKKPKVSTSGSEPS
jgi:hypothetical protein